VTGGPLWQDLAAGAVAVAAVAWLIRRRLRRRVRVTPYCGDCAACAPERPAPADRAARPGGRTVVPLSELTRPER
jgi:hypothetical protein